MDQVPLSLKHNFTVHFLLKYYDYQVIYDLCTPGDRYNFQIIDFVPQISVKF